MREKRGLGKRMWLIGNNKRFTMIEMAIVLIIIGIIICAVIKGKDLVRSGEQKKLYSTFLNAWDMAFNSYYDRTGRILGDTRTNDNTGTRDGHCSDPSETNLNNQLRNVGLEPPAVGATDSTTERTYKDSEGRMAPIEVEFDYHANVGNYIEIGEIPNDLGLAWDRIIDGVIDGRAGNFLYVTSTSTMTTSDWPSATVAPVKGSAAILNL
jgi:Tfp pilus assembly protein PilE